MVDLYARLVQEGRRTLEEVPERFRSEVEAKLTQLEGGN